MEDAGLYTSSAFGEDADRVEESQRVKNWTEVQIIGKADVRKAIVQDVEKLG